VSVTRITTDAEFRSLPEGFVFNWFGGKDPIRLAADNKLHKSSCGWVKKMNLSVTKLYSADLKEMVDYLTEKVGEENKKWSRCRFCFRKGN